MGGSAVSRPVLPDHFHIVSSVPDVSEVRGRVRVRVRVRVRPKLALSRTLSRTLSLSLSLSLSLNLTLTLALTLTRCARDYHPWSTRAGVPTWS